MTSNAWLRCLIVGLVGVSACTENNNDVGYEGGTTSGSAGEANNAAAGDDTGGNESGGQSAAGANNAAGGATGGDNGLGGTGGGAGGSGGDNAGAGGSDGGTGGHATGGAGGTSSGGQSTGGASGGTGGRATGGSGGQSTGGVSGGTGGTSSGGTGGVTCPAGLPPGSTSQFCVGDMLYEALTECDDAGNCQCVPGAYLVCYYSCIKNANDAAGACDGGFTRCPDDEADSVCFRNAVYSVMYACSVTLGCNCKYEERERCQNRCVDPPEGAAQCE